MNISGRQLVPEIYTGIEEKISGLQMKNIIPTLCIVKTKDAEDVNTYIAQKVKKGSGVGIGVLIKEFDDKVLHRRDAIYDAVKNLNDDKNIHGIIFQKPSHKNIDDSVERHIDPAKDVDGFLQNSLHKPPVYLGVLRILKEVHAGDLNKKKIVVIGKGKTGGGPVIDGLRRDGIKHVRIIDSRTTDKERGKLLAEADIVVSAVGKANPVNPSYFNPHAVLIDFGVHFEKGKVAPDFKESEISDKVAYYTTTPGGIGPLTVAYLMDNVVNAALALTQQ